MTATSTNEDLDQLVCTLSHDMNANFMLLENSFYHLKKTLARLSQEKVPRDELDGRVAHVEACLRESKRFLDDLDWLARTGAVEMEPSQVSVAAVVHQVLFEQHELLGQHNVEVDVRPLLPVVWCNEARLKQIVTNLIRNAVYHGCDFRRPRIVIGSAAPGEGAKPGRKNAMAAFQIHDNGPGIDRRFHDEIFRPGRRLAAKRVERSDMGGSGMGLAIVQRIAEYYGGLVSIDPNCDVGTAFVVVLPNAGDRTSADPDVEQPRCEDDGLQWKLGLDAQHRKHRRPRHGKFASSGEHHRR